MNDKVTKYSDTEIAIDQAQPPKPAPIVISLDNLYEQQSMAKNDLQGVLAQAEQRRAPLDTEIARLQELIDSAISLGVKRSADLPPAP